MDWHLLEIAFRDRLVCLPSRELSCVEAAVNANVQAYEEIIKKETGEKSKC